MALGSGSITTAITSIASSLLIQLLNQLSVARGQWSVTPQTTLGRCPTHHIFSFAIQPGPKLAHFLATGHQQLAPIPLKSLAHSSSPPRSVRSGRYSYRL